MAGNWISLGAAIAKEATLSALRASFDDTFKNLLKFEPREGYELRVLNTAGARYHGMAADSAAEDQAVWSTVRFYKDAAGEIVRVRFKRNLAWNAVEAGGW